MYTCIKLGLVVNTCPKVSSRIFIGLKLLSSVTVETTNLGKTMNIGLKMVNMSNREKYFKYLVINLSITMLQRLAILPLINKSLKKK